MDKEELRKFAFILGGCIVGGFGFLLPWKRGEIYPLWPWIVLGVLLIWSLIIPQTLSPVYRFWMAIGHWLGWFNSRIILGLVFYFIFVPVGFIMRISGRKPVKRHFTNDISYRVTSINESTDHMEKPF